MKILKEILGRIFALWALMVFASTLLLIYIPVGFVGLYKEPKRTIYTFIFYRFWMTLFFTLSGVKRKFVGRKHFQKGETYVVVCNHRALMDPPLSSPAIPAPNKTIAKIEMARIPVFGLIYKRGSVLVDRKSEESRRQSYNRMKEVLSMRLHMCIYPEGTRNKTSQPLQRFQDGAFKLAVETNKRIIPALLFNTDKVLPRKPFFFWPQPVEMHFLPPVDVQNKTAKELKEEVFEIMKNYYVQHQKS
ncbi:MAG TPA: lysophospholipid acyltransferase family protein [Flavisolibacter sp.]|nr:lysophospholipid acyltransferase family protein [Flavisolibacter sp.]